jgi:shikimate kinase
VKQSRNLILVGLMGAGKTTVGRILARRLGMQFVDSDHEVERRCGVNIPVIFELEGEAGFRMREAQLIDELTRTEGIVLATGGGAVLAEANRRCLATRGTVIYLNARPEDLERRVKHDRNRPLLAGGGVLEKLTRLHAERDPLYRAVADLVVDTGAQTPQSLARDLLVRLEEVWKRSA